MTKDSLTEAQLQAITTIDRSVGIVANAGAGKTRVLVERVIHIVESKGINLHNILLTTFTEKAAQELRARLVKGLSLGNRIELLGANITTFHGLAMRVLQEHAPTAKLPTPFRLASQGESEAILHRAVESSILRALDDKDSNTEELCRRYKFRSLVPHMISLLEDRWSFERYIEQSPEYSKEVAPIIPLFQRCSAEYREQKLRRSLLDYHDLEIELWSLFRDDPKILSDYQRQYKHIFVDEFQDTNPLQTAIIKQLFTPPDNVLCIVGDPKQSIYRFRRADVQCFSDMLSLITEAGGETITLSDNFRSTPDVVTFTNTICADMPDYTPLRAHRTQDGHTSIIPIPIRFDTKPSAKERRQLEIQSVIDYIPKIIESGGDYSKIACLFQTRKALQTWADAFRNFGFPIHVYCSSGFWERPEIGYILTALRVVSGIISGKPDERHLLAMLISPLFSISLDDIYRWRHMSPNGKTSQTDHPLHTAVSAHSSVGNWIDGLHELALTRTPYEMIQYIIQSTNYLQSLLLLDPTGQMSSNVETLLRRVHLLTQDSAMTLQMLLEQLLELKERGENTPDSPAIISHDNAIQLMTIHAAKGNEFHTVVLADCTYEPRHTPPHWLFEPSIGFAIKYIDDKTPDLKSTEEWEVLADQYRHDDHLERQRLLYVALTRAENQLVIPVFLDPLSKKDKTTNRNWHEIIAPHIVAAGQSI